VFALRRLLNVEITNMLPNYGIVLLDRSDGIDKSKFGNEPEPRKLRKCWHHRNALNWCKTILCNEKKPKIIICEHKVTLGNQELDDEYQIYHDPILMPFISRQIGVTYFTISAWIWSTVSILAKSTQCNGFDSNIMIHFLSLIQKHGLYFLLLGSK
jgi:hypothetical protein